MAKRVHRPTFAVLPMTLGLVTLAISAAALFEGGRWVIAVGVDCDFGRRYLPAVPKPMSSAREGGC